MHDDASLVPDRPARRSLRQARPSRRTVLVGGMLGVGSLLAPAACGHRRGPELTPEISFGASLPVPEIATSRLEDGIRVFTLRAGEGTHEFTAGTTTSTWGFNGGYLGPTLRAAAGEAVRVDIRNDLPEPTTVHWHGMHLPARADGGPHQLIGRGDTWRPQWRILQDPATLWYHPHPHGATEKHLYRGLAGMFILDGASGALLPELPHEYGVDDLPVIVQDKKVDREGQLVFDDGGNEVGLLGNLFLVNGVAGAVHEITTRQARLRLLNASTARVYEIGMADRRVLQLVATDGGLLARPVSLTSIRLSPGERAEVVVPFGPGETVRLQTFGARLGGVVVPHVFGAADRADLVEFRAAPTLRASAAVPSALPAPRRLTAAEATRRREFVLQGRTINGRRMDPGRVDTVATLGDVERWLVRSRNPVPHNFHVHDVQFQVVAVDGRTPPAELAGRKDTIYLEPHVTYELVMHFTDYADATHPYMYHCHLLLHEDDGMMGQLLVVAAGDDEGDRRNGILIPDPGHRH